MKKKSVSTTSEKEWHKELQSIALIMTLHCVRNTVIEDYHAAGQLSQDDMKAFNKEVADKIYSILQVLLNPHYAKVRQELFSTKPSFQRPFCAPSNWDQPKFDKEFLYVMKVVKRRLKKKYS